MESVVSMTFFFTETNLVNSKEIALIDKSKKLLVT